MKKRKSRKESRTKQIYENLLLLYKCLFTSSCFCFIQRNKTVVFSFLLILRSVALANIIASRILQIPLRSIPSSVLYLLIVSLLFSVNSLQCINMFISLFICIPFSQFYLSLFYDVHVIVLIKVCLLFFILNLLLFWWVFNFQLNQFCFRFFFYFLP